MNKLKNIVLPTTPEIENACELLEQFKHRVLESREAFPAFGEYEAGIEGLNLLYLMIRNVESIITLAREDLVLLPSAMNLTRSTFEIAMKTLWMLAPNDAFEREVRWLAQLQTEEEYYARVSKRFEKLGIDNNSLLNTKNEITKFRLDVTEKLPEPYKSITQIPNLAAMMKEINEEQKYPHYIILSQYSHGTHAATGIYRKGLGTEKVFGEFISPKNWEIVFTLCWYCLAKTSERIYEIFGGDVNLILPNEFIQEIQMAISKIKNS